jgi:glycosyltransferase involved in cell wall biosynthesis
VRFVGRVAEDELLDWYRAADLFVLPTVAYEGFGMVTVKALASGTPVVGTPAGATPELLEPLDQRLVARGSDPDSLAAAIREALAFIGDDFRTRCREYPLARFDWSHVNEV